MDCHTKPALLAAWIFQPLVLGPPTVTIADNLCFPVTAWVTRYLIVLGCFAAGTSENWART